MFIPTWGQMIQFDEHILQMRWFNHQLAHRNGAVSVGERWSLMKRRGASPGGTSNVHLGLGGSGRVEGFFKRNTQWCPQMGVSNKNGTYGTPKSSILIGFSILNHPFWGKHLYFGNIQMWLLYIFPQDKHKISWKWKRMKNTSDQQGKRCYIEVMIPKSFTFGF